MPNEFDRQVENLVRKGYPKITGVPEEEFRRRLGPLRERLGDLAAPNGAGQATRLPFAIVVSGGVVPGDRAMPLVELDGRPGFTTMAADDVQRFAPLAGLVLPAGLAYAVVDVDTGRQTLNVTPDAALGTIQAEHRSPLTLDEGIALLTHYPAILRTHNCFSMLGSRCGDRRVTALWVSDGRPRLGWCWAGNPHTWLGSASCAARIGA
jgi:hypothetical protein